MATRPVGEKSAGDVVTVVAGAVEDVASGVELIGADPIGADDRVAAAAGVVVARRATRDRSAIAVARADLRRCRSGVLAVLRDARR
jgi:predicted ribosome-associated RNA-binding protein Tma20